MIELAQFVDQWLLQAGCKSFGSPNYSVWCLLYSDEGHSPYFTPEKLVQFAIGYLSLSNEFRNHLVTARAREVRKEGISGGVIGTLLAEQHKPFSSKSITIDDPPKLTPKSDRANQ